MYNGDGIKLTGDDGFVQKAQFGTAYIGDGIVQLPEGIYFITKVAAASAFPAPALSGTEITAGYFLNVSATDAIIPAVDDDCILMVLTDKCDVSSFLMTFAKNEIDTTTLCDALKTYRNGRPDMTGTINGVFTVGTTDDPLTGSLRQFITVIKQDGDTSYDIFLKENEILLGIFYTNKDVSLADQMYIIAAYVFNGLDMGAEIDSAQTFTGGFRFASLEEGGIPVIPAFYRIGDGL